MLQPARRKYRKEQKGRNTGVATRGATVAFGDFGLKCTDRGRLTARQIEAARRAISRHVKRGGRIWIRVFPHKPKAPAGGGRPPGQMGAARRATPRHVKRGGRIWIRVFPDKPISTKPAEVRMGNGKGNPEYYVAEIQPGKI